MNAVSAAPGARAASFTIALVLSAHFASVLVGSPEGRSIVILARERFDVTLEDVHVIDENVTFKLPASLVSNG